MTMTTTRSELWDAINAWSAGTGDLARLAAALDEHEKTVRAEAIARAERAEEAADLLRGECRDGEHGPWCREWRAMVARAEGAESALAALRQAACDLSASAEDDDPNPPLWAALDAALTDSAATAEAYTRRVQADALEEAADEAGKHHFAMGGLAGAEKWLRERAERIRRGAL